jgi:D-tyrosyl-tRNA(Tyr) deacylase
LGLSKFVEQEKVGKALSRGEANNAISRREEIGMRAVVQRVKHASVSVDNEAVGTIGPGLVVLLGVKNADSQAEAKWLAHKVANLRIFADEQGKMNLSALDVGGAALVASQFTLYGNVHKGFRPSFTDAAPPEVAEPLVDFFVQCLREEGLHVETGVFQAMMLVEIHNDGPVTIVLEK